MSGPTSKVVYTADNSVDYYVRMPLWLQALQTPTAATTEAPLPKGIRPRKRYWRNTATGRERALTVHSASDALYTSPFGSAISIPTLGSGTATAGTLTGRTGERDKAI